MVPYYITWLSPITLFTIINLVAYLYTEYSTGLRKARKKK
jgi:hypothetical protein